MSSPDLPRCVHGSVTCGCGVAPTPSPAFAAAVEEYAQERISQVTCSGGLKCVNAHKHLVEDARAALVRCHLEEVEAAKYNAKWVPMPKPEWPEDEEGNLDAK